MDRGALTRSISGWSSIESVEKEDHFAPRSLMELLDGLGGILTPIAIVLDDGAAGMSIHEMGHIIIEAIAQYFSDFCVGIRSPSQRASFSVDYRVLWCHFCPYFSIRFLNLTQGVSKGVNPPSL